MELCEPNKKHDIVTDEYLKKSCQLYHQGKFKECMKALKKVNFTVFDSNEWNLENNLLICETKVVKASDFNNLAEKFEELIEKVTGIPPCPQSLLQEISIGLNYCSILLSGHVTNKLIDASFKAGNILTNSILRVSQTLGFNNEWTSTTMTCIPLHETFHSKVLKNTVELVGKLLERSSDTQYFVLLAKNCWILAVLWISQHEVDAGFNLLNVLNENLTVLNNNPIPYQETILVDTSYVKHVFPLSLLPHSNEHGILSIKAAVNVLSSLCYKCYKKDLVKALGLLDSSIVTDCSNTSFYANYLKGVIYYDKDDIDNAFQYFNQCISNTAEIIEIENENKAACFSMLGCCLAKKGKHHTAISKFKEALTYDFSHLDSLFYIAQEYQALDKDDADIQCLKYLCEALVTRRSETVTTQYMKSLLQGHFIQFVDRLMGRTVNRTYATYWMGKRCLLLNRFEEASEALLDVLTEAHHSRRTQIPTPYVLPSLLSLSRDCAFALLQSGKYKDCVTICEKALDESEKEVDKHELWDPDVKSMRKRIREASELSQQASEFQTCYLELILCKAEALSHMNLLLQSLECLQRVFDALDVDTLLHTDKDNTTDFSQHFKRRKLETGDSKCDPIANKEDTICFASEDDNYAKKRLLQIKSQAHLIRTSVLQALDKEKESLEELHQSLLCDQDNLAALYNYSKLLMKLGSKNVAASYWIKYRGLDISTKIASQNLKTRARGFTDGLCFCDITDKQLNDMDESAMKICC